MGHLRADEFVDIAEGTRAESSSAHLASCEACRGLLADARAAMAAAADADVPEPSPLFWNHFSQRVREAVANDASRARGWRTVLHDVSWRRAALPLGGLAAAVLIAFALAKTLAPAPHGAASPAAGTSVAAPDGTIDAAGDASIDADPLLAIVASLASAMEFDAGAVLEDSATAEHAVAHLTDDELREMQRMLQNALQREQSGD